MPSLMEALETREAAARGRGEGLREQLEATESAVSRLVITRQTVEEVLAVPLPITTSALLGGGARVDRGRPGSRAGEVGDQRGTMVHRAAATGLTGCDERVRDAAPATDGRQGEGQGDPRPAPSDRGVGAPTGQGEGAVHPERSGVLGGAAAPAAGAAPQISAGAAVALVADTVFLGLAATGLPTRALLRGHLTEAAAGRQRPFTATRGTRCSGPRSSARMNGRPRIRRHGPTVVPDPPPRVALETSRCSSASSTRRRKHADTFAWRPCH